MADTYDKAVFLNKSYIFGQGEESMHLPLGKILILPSFLTASNSTDLENWTI